MKPRLCRWLLLIVIGVAGSALAQDPITFQYFYDSLNQLVRVIDSAGNVITYTYDQVGNLTSVTRTTVANLPPPMLTSVTPSQVNQEDPATVMLMGTGLLGGTVTTTHPGIKITGSALIDDTKITVYLNVASNAQLGPAPITVTTIRGSASININVVGPRPRITAISPSQGPSTGGTPVTVKGKYFTADTVVTIGGKLATNIKFVDGSTLTADTPTSTSTQPPTCVDVVVSNPFGSSTLTKGFCYIFGLECGSLVQGFIATQGEIDRYAFNGVAGNVVLLTLVRTSAWAFTTTAQVTVESPSGVVVVTFDADSQRRLTLSESGVYTIRVYANNLVSGGSYNLGLECLRPLGPVDGILNCGSLLSGAIGASGEVDILTFEGQANQVVLLTLVRTSAWAFTTTAQATVESPSGVVVVTFDADSQRRLTLSESGVYTIRVYANNLVSGGSYNLGLECLRPLGPVDGTLNCGSLLSGAIGASGEVDILTFEGQANQVVLLTLVRTSAWAFTTTAQVTVESPSGVVVVTFDADSQRRLTLSESGVYTIRVYANNLVSGGSYNLGLECLRPLGPVDGTLNCGSLLSGAISASGEVDIVTFTGQANQIVLLTLVNTSAWAFGTTAQATVEAPSGTVVATLNANDQRQITLPESGIYIIRVNSSDLVSTGSYELRMQCPP